MGWMKGGKESEVAWSKALLKKDMKLLSRLELLKEPKKAPEDLDQAQKRFWSRLDVRLYLDMGHDVAFKPSLKLPKRTSKDLSSVFL